MDFSRPLSAERPLSDWDRLALFVCKVKHWQWVLFFVGLLISLRLFLTLTHAPFLGIDGGAYFLSALRVLGEDSTSVGFPRPPLAPGWLLVPFIKLWGFDVGYKIWSALFSAFPLLPVYLLTRSLVNKSAAIFALAFFSVDIMQMEMMVNGSLPLIGFTCIGMAIWAIFDLVHRWFYWRYWLVLVASVALLPYVNQTAAAIGVIVLPVTVLGCWFFAKRDLGELASGPKRVNLITFVLPAALIGFLIGLGSLPWYLANAPGNDELRFPGFLLRLVSWQDSAFLLQTPIVCTVVFLLFKATKDYRVRTLALVIGVLGFLILWLARDEALINIFFRSRYLLGLFVYPAIAYILCKNWPIKDFALSKDWIWVVPMVVVWSTLLWWQVKGFELQTGFQDMILPETKQALDIAKVERPAKAIITNAYSMSHWVAALNQVESPSTWGLEPSPYYKESDYHVRCLLGWVDGCDAQASTQALNAGYILIDERIPGEVKGSPIYGRISDNEWANLPDVPWLRLKFSQGSIKLWEIRDGS